MKVLLLLAAKNEEIVGIGVLHIVLTATVIISATTTAGFQTAVLNADRDLMFKGSLDPSVYSDSGAVGMSLQPCSRTVEGNFLEQ